VSEARRRWDSRSYDRVSGPMEAMGREVLARLSLAGDETVLDAGCGTGRVTQALLERLPRGRVIAVDASADMVAVARERLAGARVELQVQDLLALDLAEPVDAALSTATFHLIADHETLFARLRAALRPGGALVAQCGGAGNIRSVQEAAAAIGERDPYAAHLAGFTAPRNLATPEETQARLRAAGFTTARAWLQPQPITPEDPVAYLRTINLGSHVNRLPADLHEPFARDVAAELADAGGRVTIDYVRLNIDAAA
jgi:trans-aconitate 2-methyltransferase